MDNKKILTMYDPVITSWQWHATMFSILNGNSYAQNWIFSSYIQLIAEKKTDFFLDIAPGHEGLNMCPYLFVVPIADELVDENVADYFLKVINLGYFIYGIFDESILLNKPKNKFYHQLLICGYDLDKEVFYVADFTFNHKYSIQQFSINSIIEAYITVPTVEDKLFEGYCVGKKGIVLLSPNTKKQTYCFNIELVKQSINDYLECKNPYRGMQIMLDDDKCNFMYYGVEVYEGLKSEIEQNIFSPKIFHVLYDHKKLMNDRIYYMINNNFLNTSKGEICELSRDVVNDSLILRNAILKASMKQTSKDKIDKYIVRINALRDKECTLLNMLIQNI